MSSDDKQINKMQNKRITRSWIFFFLSIVLWVEQASLATAFVQTTLSPGSKQNNLACGSITTSSRSKLPENEPSCFSSYRRSNGNNRVGRQSTELFFMGSDGGVLGIGTPELVSRHFHEQCVCSAFFSF